MIAAVLSASPSRSDSPDCANPWRARPRHDGKLQHPVEQTDPLRLEMRRRVEVLDLADELRAHLHARRKRRERETRMARNQAGPIIPHTLPDRRDDAQSGDDDPVQAKLALAARSPST